MPGGGGGGDGGNERMHSSTAQEAKKKKEKKRMGGKERCECFNLELSPLRVQNIGMVIKALQLLKVRKQK